jgi:hypothetical protein
VRFIAAVSRTVVLWVVLSLAYGLSPHFPSEVQPGFAPQAVAPKASFPAHRPFEVGETFVYSVSWKIFDAGIATLRLAEMSRYQNEEVYKVTATARSTGILSRVFQVLDFFESYFQVKDLCARRLTKKIQEGSRKRETVLTFDPKAHRARLEDKDTNDPELPAKHSESDIPACVQDVISALYLIRTKTLRVGEQVSFPINDGGKTYDVSVEVQATEEVRTPAGEFQTIRLEPRVFEGLFRKRGRMFIWLTNDSHKMPVQLKARMNIGTITAWLTRVSSQPALQPSNAPPGH